MAAIVEIIGEEIIVKAKNYFYGTMAEDDIVKAIDHEINQMWNQPLVVYFYNQQYYKVKFDIRSEIVDEAAVLDLISHNLSHEFNFIRIENKGKIDRSMMGFGLGENSGFWVTSDNLGHSTTAAHEFGHAIGLPHPNIIDYRGMGYPPLMAPRGTLVDSELQWNVLADPGTYGGTMRPDHRRVRQDEVLSIMGRMVYVTDNNFIIGKLSNIYFDAAGNFFKTDGSQPLTGIQV